jgi:hypothetical protein
MTKEKEVPLFTEEFIKDTVFTYLEDLRVSGKTNMFGAVPYLERDFGMPRAKAREALAQWMAEYEKPSVDGLFDSVPKTQGFEHWNTKGD